MSQTLLTITLGLVMLLGLAGTVVPILPDVALIWGAALAYGLLVGWGEWGPWFFGGITLLGALGLLPELWVSGMGARRGGASLRALLVGFVLGAVGLLLAGPLAAVIGLLAGTFLVEYLRKGEPRDAARATLGMGLGCGVSYGVKLLMGSGMVMLWLVWVLSR